MYCEISQWSKDTRLKHYVTPHLEHGKPDIAVIRIGSKNVSYNNLKMKILREYYKNWEEMH